jgi:hypothetical protein
LKNQKLNAICEDSLRVSNSQTSALNQGRKTLAFCVIVVRKTVVRCTPVLSILVMYGSINHSDKYRYHEGQFSLKVLPRVCHASNYTAWFSGSGILKMVFFLPPASGIVYARGEVNESITVNPRNVKFCINSPLIHPHKISRSSLIPTRRSNKHSNHG